MLLDIWIDELPNMRSEASVSPFLIRAHEQTVACHIGGENTGQPAFDAFRGQSGASNRMGRMDHRL